MNPENIQRFIKTSGWKFNKCLEPMMECPEKAIRAHSIQNAQVLDLLATDGHLVMLQPSFSEMMPNIEFKSVGRNQASTFSGLCSAHDASLFRALDTKPFNLKDPQQLFLLAYRSVTRELHAIMDGAVKIQSEYSSRVDRGLDPSDGPSTAGIMATSHLINSHSTWAYRAENFDSALLSESYDKIKHNIIIFDDQPPTIAVSALFSLDEIKSANDVVRVVLNVFPVSKDRTIAIFSYTKEDRTKALPALRSILLASGHKQKHELSKLILNHIENFVLSPAYFKNWTQEKTERINDYFVKTLFENAEISDDSDFMLF